MNILGIECSGKVAGVAVSREGYVVYEALLDGQLTHSQIILPMVEEALRKGELDYDNIDAVACNVGPGSFTGARIGCSTANALGAATGARLVAIDALTALVYNVSYFDGWVVPVLDARADRVYAGVYGEGAWRLPPTATTVEELRRALPSEGPLLFLGEGGELHFPAFAQGAEGRTRLAPMHLRRHRAATLAALATEKLGRGETVERCQPLYLRASQAEQERTKSVH